MTDPRSGRSWYLNFDAEPELERPAGYHGNKRVQEQVRAQGRHFQALVRGENIFDPEAPPPAGTPAMPWCPTPSALRVLGAHGLRVPKAPTLETLQRVNHRRFAVDLPSLLDEHVLGREYVEPGDDLRWVGRGVWRLKRPYGFAGKGQRVLPERPSDDDWRWIHDSLRQGFSRERQLTLLAEWSLHGYLDRTTALPGTLCRQHTDAWGRVRSLAPVRSALDATGSSAQEGLPVGEREGESRRESPAAELLSRVWDTVAGRLSDAGYWGPFGIDLLTFPGPEGRTCHAVSEVNARFTLGWSLGLGDQRETALRRLFEVGGDG